MYTVPTNINHNHGNKKFDQFYFGLFFKKYSVTELNYYYRFLCGWMRYLDSILDLNSNGKKKVLEIGCGIGAFAKILDERKFEVHATDISSFIIDQAKKLQNHIYFFVSDIEKGINTKNKYDYIFTFEVMEHLSDPLKALLNIKKLLKEKGILIISTPLPTALVLSDPMHINVHPPHYWENIAGKAGFKVKASKAVSFIPFLYRFNAFFSRPLPFSTNHKFINTTYFLILEK